MGTDIPAADVYTVARYAREWVADCEWSEDDIRETLAAMSDDAVIRAAAHHYDGGTAALYRDAMASTAAPAMMGEPAAAAAEHEAMQAAVTSQDLRPLSPNSYWYLRAVRSLETLRDECGTMPAGKISARCSVILGLLTMATTPHD